MGKKLSELVESAEAIVTDLFHLRTVGGIDKKITYDNLLIREVGEVASFITKTRPSWLWCDGATIDKTVNPEYTILVDLLKAEHGADAAHPYYHADADKAILPDLRGASVRGVDAAANRDKDGERKSGDYQVDGNDPHVHTIDHGHGNTGPTGSHVHALNWRDAAGAEGTTSISGPTPTDAATDEVTSDMSNPGNHEHTTPNHTGNSESQGADEGTVKNIALYYLIKY